MINGLELVPISSLDIEWLAKTEYKNLSNEQRLALVQDSNNCKCRGEFFKFYLIKNFGENIGVINMCGHGREVVSVAPEILKEYRQKGYGKASLELAYALAKGFGFTKLRAGIREDNVSSINLHLKLGFTFKENYVSKNGNKLKIFVKAL